jgi:hypothetical protein
MSGGSANGWPLLNLCTVLSPLQHVAQIAPTVMYFIVKKPNTSLKHLNFFPTAFGYHVGVVNGPLEVIAADLGFAGNKALEGAVVGGGSQSASDGKCDFVPVLTFG